MNRLYYSYIREDGIDVECNPVYNANTFIAAHSWESAISVPTNPARTSTVPWISINLIGIINEDLVVEYKGEVVKN